MTNLFTSLKYFREQFNQGQHVLLSHDISGAFIFIHTHSTQHKKLFVKLQLKLKHLKQFAKLKFNYQHAWEHECSTQIIFINVIKIKSIGGRCLISCGSYYMELINNLMKYLSRA